MLKIIKFRYKQIWMDEMIIRKNLDKKIIKFRSPDMRGSLHTSVSNKLL